MSPFVFRLDPVLRIRSSERDQRRAELADALAQLQELDQAIAAIDHELVRARAERTRRPGAMTADRLQAADAYEGLLRERRQSQEELRIAAAAELAGRREALLASDRAVRSLELLREAEWERYRAEQRRRETRELDELASRPFSPS
jgi:flagellar export protein FliJ